MNAPDPLPLRLTQFSHGGGCGCKIAPGVLQEIIAKAGPLPKFLRIFPNVTEITFPGG